MPIRILSEEVASQIAAGEVVERPASVVKELLENSLDAGATFVSISIEGAGQGLIEVADDGSGIAADELQLAVTRHATSKLQTAEDLFKIETLGFRGEALASIASVSRFTITTRPQAAQMGVRLRVEGGIAQAPQPVGAPGGTVVRVEDLFFNVPARKKFLKTDRTERKQIDTLVTRYALAYPNVRFQLRQENRQSLQTTGKGDRREVLANLYGVEIAKQMIDVLAQDEDLKISGFTSPTTITRSNRQEILFFVNGRPVQDAALTTALARSYHTMIMVGKYPMAVLFLEIPAHLVDVNVHPAKAEVRYRDRDGVFRGVGRAVRRALLANTPIPELDAAAPQSSWSTTWGRDGFDRHKGLDPIWGMASDKRDEETNTRGATDPSDRHQQQLPEISVPLLRLVGQLASTYLIAEGPDGLYLIDQHAAHERVLFEKYLAQSKSKVVSQALLEPVTVELSPAASGLLEAQLGLLEPLGFQVEPFGKGTFLLRSIPALLSKMNPGDALRVLVEDFEEDETPLQEEVEAKLIARICKRAAVKGGQVLSPQEQDALLRDLETCQAPRTCPHGRPTMIHLSVDLLARQFGRRGAI